MLEYEAGGPVIHGGFDLRQVGRSVGRGNDDQLALQIGKIRAQNLTIFGMNGSEDDDLLVSVGDAHRHESGFADGRPPFVEAGVADVHPRQPANERLVFEERLQASLARLGLVRSVGRIEFAAARDLVDGRGNEMVVNAAAHEADAAAAARIA